MIKQYIIFFLLVAGGFSPATLFAQRIPTASNQRNDDGKRVGDWVITYNKAWKETTLADSTAYYRVIHFDTQGTPIGKTTDYYRSGNKQWEGVMLQIEPSEIPDGPVMRFNAYGDTTKLYYQNNMCLDSLLSTFIENYENQDYKGAVRFFLPIYEGSKWVYGSETFATLSNLLGVCFYYLGKTKQAESLFLEALEIQKKILGDQHPDYATILNNLAALYKSQGTFDKAEPLLVEALRIIKKVLGEHHTDYALILNNLALFYVSQGSYENAESLHLEAMSIRKKNLGEQHPVYASSLNNLASLYKSQGEYDNAESLYFEALAIYKKTLGEQHPDYATVLSNIAGIYESQGIYNKAESLYLQAAAILKKHLGEQHPFYATSLNNLATLYTRQGSYDKAESLYLEALEIRKKSLGEQHPDYASSLNNLAALYGSQGAYTKTEPLYAEAYKINKANLIDFFNRASQQQQESYWEANKYSFIWSYLWAKKQPSMQMLSYSTALLTKGLRLTSIANLQEYLISSQDTAVVNRYQQYLSVKRTLGLEYSKPISGRIGMAALEAEAEQLEKELVRRSAAFRDFKRSFEITHTEVQQALKPNEAAVEFVDYAYHNGKEWTDTTYYAALVLRPGWAMPKMVQLCEKRQLEQIIATNGQQRRAAYVEKLYGYRGRGLPIAGNISNNLPNLYQLLWQPIDSLLGGVSTVHYAPSGLLHRLNLAAIAKNDTQRLGDVYDLRQLSSTRQLAQNSTFNSTTERSLLVGNVTYDADSTQLVAVNRSYSNTQGEQYAARNLAQSRGGAWGALANTGPEIKTIAMLSPQADTLTAHRATEEAFYYYLGKQPRIVHLATHGFFYEPPQDTLQRKKDQPVFTNATDALMRSGLVLAGANRVWQGKAPVPNQEDGILTAYEISLKDLRQTELVVMSACETGLGDIKGSEGVFGLQRAFKIAGAKNIIMSLWQVPDKATRQMMEVFYTHYLREKKPIREAFKLAVNHIKQQYEEPYFWAGFVLVE